MKYAVKVTLSWSSSVPGPKLQLYANSPYTLIGSFNSTANLSTAIVNGTNASGPTAFYCQGVTVIIDQSI